MKIMKTSAHRIILLTMFLTLRSSVADDNFPKRWASLAVIDQNTDISYITILRMPDGYLKRSAATREELRDHAFYAITFKESSVWSFKMFLAGVSIRPNTHGADLRWAVLLFDSKGKEIGSLFLDNSGNDGYLDDRLVSFQSNDPESSLVKRLRALLSVALH
jgi:hypothetical protein